MTTLSTLEHMVTLGGLKVLSLLVTTLIISSASSCVANGSIPTVQDEISVTQVKRWSLIVVFTSFCWLSSCTDSAPGKYEPSKCYQGTLIRAFCPGIAVVAVSNANIGIDWTWNGKTYNNALTITNFQTTDSLGRDIPVYFTIDTDASAQGAKCTVDIPCLQWNYDQSSPNERVCVKYISTKSCNQP